MGYRNRINILSLLLFFITELFAAPLDYGLYFQSNSVPSNQRTTLVLNGGNPFLVDEEFMISFQMMIRNKPNYGSIFCLRINDSENLYLALIGKDDGELHPALVCDERIVEIQQEVKGNEWLSVSLRINKRQNAINLHFGQKDTTFISPLQEVKAVKVEMGRVNGYETDVVSMNIKNIEIVQNRTKTYCWLLKNHNGDICYDEIGDSPAHAYFPKWLIDRHLEWQEIYSGSTAERFDIAFNEKDALFYMIYPDKIETLNAMTGIVTTTKVEGGYPAIEYPNHLLYDVLTGQLISYFYNEQRVSYFSFDKGTWSLADRSFGKAHDYNHARAYNPSDSSYYFFGGYGFHQYHNHLYRLKVGDSKIGRITYQPLIEPRFSAAAAVVDNKLYIFGGGGNKQGRQELGATFYHELNMIDLKSGQSHLVWRKDWERNKELTLAASSMCFEPQDSSFYVFSLKDGGTLWKIPMKDDEWRVMARPVKNNIIHQDYDLNLYSSPLYNKLFVVMDKVLADQTHHFFIYSIDTPLMQEDEIRQQVKQKEQSAMLVCLIGGGCLLLCFCFTYYIYRKRGKWETDLELQDSGQTEDTEELLQEEVYPKEEKIYFDRSRSAISLLGVFNVRDKNGKDITTSFTPLLKSLLSLLILYSQSEKKGILVKQLNEILWMDKDELAARNNRNVALRKLRVLLDEIGTVEIIKEASALRIELGEEVFCDYYIVCNYINGFRTDTDNNDPEVYAKIVELLLYGPLLPSLRFDWLDDFKAAYSNYSIDWLDNLLDMERKKQNDRMILRIVDTMFLHDPLNENALSAKCHVLYKNDRKGLAKKVYDKFAKEYEEMLGEEYKISFSNIINKGAK